MVWAPVQRERLAIEKENLEKYFRLGVTWIDPQNKTKVEVLLKSNSDKEYKLRIYIPADFPNSCPVLVVVQPKTLLLKNGSRLPESSNTFHTLPDADGFHRICHFYPPDWTPDITLYQVLMKGRLWIEGYEAHLSTGKDMDAFLKEQKETQRPQNNAQNIQRESLIAPRAAEQQVSNSPLPSLGRALGRNTSSTRYSNLSDVPVSPNPLNSGDISPLPTARNVNEPVGNQHLQRRATYSNPASNSRRGNNLNSARSISLGRLTSPLSTANYGNEQIPPATRLQRRNTDSNPTSNPRGNNRNPVQSNPLHSNISPLPTARNVNEPLPSPTSNSRRGNNLNSARSNSLTRFTSPPPTASYGNEPVDTYTPDDSLYDDDYDINYYGDDRELNITAQNEESQIFYPVHDMTTSLRNLSRQNSSNTVAVGSARELTTNLPPPCHVSNEGAAYDANNNHEEAPSQNAPPPRYRPAGGVFILPPFREKNAPILRRVPPKAKPKPRR